MTNRQAKAEVNRVANHAFMGGNAQLPAAKPDLDHTRLTMLPPTGP